MNTKQKKRSKARPGKRFDPASETSSASPNRKRITLLVVAAAIAGLLYLQLERDTGPEPPSAATAELLKKLQQHYEAGEIDAGIAAAQSHLEVEPQAPGVHYVLGSFHAAKGDDPAAIAAFEEAVERDGKHAASHLGLGRNLSLAGRAEEANQALRRSLALDPGLHEAALLLGRNLSQAGSYEEAGEHLLAAAEAGGAEARFELGLLYRKSDRGEQAEEAFRDALSLDPEHLGALYNLGQVVGALGRADESQRLLLRHAELQKQHGDLDVLAGAVQNDWADPEHQVRLGDYLLLSEKHEQAAAVYRKALENEPQPAGAALGLGRVYLETGQLQEAAQWLETARQLDPERWRASFFLGLAFHLGGNVERARAELTRSQQDGGVWGAEEYLFLGNAFLQTNLAADARLAFEKTLELDPEISTAHSKLGLLSYLEGRFEEAEEAFSQRLSSVPEDIDARMLLGIARFRLGRGDEAAEAFREALVKQRIQMLRQGELEQHLERLAALPESGPALDLYRQLQSAG